MSKYEITISGYGHEFQWHRVNQNSLEEMLKVFKKSKVKGILDTYFTGGISVDGAVFSGAYGCDIQSKIMIDGELLPKFNKTLTQSYKNSESPNIKGADLFYITQGAINGTGFIVTDKTFDANLLKVEYIDFEVMYETATGSIITKIYYDGKQVDINFEDNGVDYRHMLVTYSADEEGNVGEMTALFYDEDEEKFKFFPDEINELLK